jgi:hypothetical protein
LQHKKIIATQRDLTREIARTLATTASLRSRGGRGGERGGLRSRSKGGGGGLRSNEERRLPGYPQRRGLLLGHQSRSNGESIGHRRTEQRQSSWRACGAAAGARAGPGGASRAHALGPRGHGAQSHRSTYVYHKLAGNWYTILIQ